MKEAIYEKERIGSYFSFKSSLDRHHEAVKIDLPELCKTVYLKDLEKTMVSSKKPVVPK